MMKKFFLFVFFALIFIHLNCASQAEAALFPRGVLELRPAHLWNSVLHPGGGGRHVEDARVRPKARGQVRGQRRSGGGPGGLGSGHPSLHRQDQSARRGSQLADGG